MEPSACELHGAARATGCISFGGVASRARRKPASVVPARTARLLLRTIADQPGILAGSRSRAGGPICLAKRKECGAMRIVYDVSGLSASHSGVATYTSNLLHHLRYFSRDEVVPIAHSPQVNKTLWMQFWLPLQ